MVSSRLVRGQTDVFLLRVVAVKEGIDGYEVTIKEFYSEGNQIILNPTNTKEAKPIVGTIETIRVQGVVIGTIKMCYDKQETQTTDSKDN